MKQARVVRAKLASMGPWGLAYVKAYGQLSREVAFIAKQHPGAERALQEVLRQGLRIANRRHVGLADRARLVASATRLLWYVDRYGSKRLRDASHQAIVHLPDLVTEWNRFQAIQPTHPMKGAHHER